MRWINACCTRRGQQLSQYNFSGKPLYRRKYPMSTIVSREFPMSTIVSIEYPMSTIVPLESPISTIRSLEYRFVCVFMITTGGPHGIYCPSGCNSPFSPLSGGSFWLWYVYSFSLWRFIGYQLDYRQSREFDSCRTHFLCEKKKKKEEASPQGKNRAMWGEEAKPLKHKNDAERKSDLWQK